MYATVTSVVRPRRFFRRALVACAIALAAIVLATWLTRTPRPATPPAAAPQADVSETAPPPMHAVDVRLDLATVERHPLSRRSTVARGVPLDASTAAPEAGYEILNAAELDAITQAVQ